MFLPTFIYAWFSCLNMYQNANQPFTSFCYLKFKTHNKFLDIWHNFYCFLRRQFLVNSEEKEINLSVFSRFISFFNIVRTARFFLIFILESVKTSAVINSLIQNVHFSTVQISNHNVANYSLYKSPCQTYTSIISNVIFVVTKLSNLLCRYI